MASRTELTRQPTTVFECFNLKPMPLIPQQPLQLSTIQAHPHIVQCVDMKLKHKQSDSSRCVVCVCMAPYAMTNSFSFFLQTGNHRPTVHGIVLVTVSIKKTESELSLSMEQLLCARNYSIVSARAPLPRSSYVNVRSKLQNFLHSCLDTMRGHGR